MMKSIFFGIVALMFAAVVMHQEQASVLATETKTLPAGKPEVVKWQTMGNASCATKLQDQINLEFNAAIFYLQYAAYFEKYDVNLPGFAKFFFNAASEEREHGMKLIDYALMRGQDPIISEKFFLDFKNTAKQLETEPSSEKSSPALKALEQALEKEEEVTTSIRTLIKLCEGEPNDFHLVDYLTGEFLDEQHKGQRELAGKKKMLEKMLKTNPHLGDFIFDKQNM